MVIIPNLERADAKHTANICNHRIVHLYFYSRSHTAKTAVLQSVTSGWGLLQKPIMILKLFLNRKR